MSSPIEEELVSAGLSTSSDQGQRPRIVPWQLIENIVSMTDQDQTRVILRKAGDVDIRVQLIFQLHSTWHYQDWWITWIPLMVPRAMRKKKMRSVRDQNLLLLDLPLVDHRANMIIIMMRLWESLKWSQGMRKGLKRQTIRNSKMLKKLPQDIGDKTEPEDRGPGEIHGGFGSATLRERLERINESRTVAPATLHSGEGTENSADPPQFSRNIESKKGGFKDCMSKLHFRRTTLHTPHRNFEYIISFTYSHRKSWENSLVSFVFFNPCHRKTTLGN